MYPSIRGERRTWQATYGYCLFANNQPLHNAWCLFSLKKLEVNLKNIDVKIFSTIDLRRAYHQLPVKDAEKYYTAVKADDKLYNFSVCLFGSLMESHVFKESLTKLFKMRT
ncbi:hypothetical protein CEXT_646881 [Caerostris extrusa]|uniref:Reverse transcriptase domain-containing protein n=1 Tax=Caerostris extrusa TaxID=172846 RepID=A0AAV4XYD5_CAEEX|nr:hypothetical protein CEXT_646881 [Caerostris extrusa]